MRIVASAVSAKLGPASGADGAGGVPPEALSAIFLFESASFA